MKNKTFTMITIAALLAVGLSAVAGGVPRTAQADAPGWPCDTWNCKAGDVTVDRVWLGDDEGNDLEPCDPGDEIEAYLWITLTNGTGAERYCLWATYEVWIDGVDDSKDMCVTPLIATGATAVYPLGDAITWICGQEVELKNLVISWDTSWPGDPPADCTDCGTPTCTSRKTQCDGPTNYIVEAPLVADFESNSPKCFCTYIDFTDLSTGGVVNPSGPPPYIYSWDFGDGMGTSTEQNPSYHYDAPDTYTVTLTITDYDTPPNQDSTTHDVTVYANPDCTITAPLEVCANMSGFSASVQDAGAGASYAWGITGGTIDSGSGTREISWSSGAAGTATITIEITDDNGCSCNDSTDVTINAAPDCTITAPLEVCEDSSGFSASVADAGVGASYAWGITGGSIDSGSDTSSISWSSGAAGTATISISITGDNGCSCSDSTDVSVVVCNPPPPPPPPAGGGRSCCFDIVMLGGEEFTIEVDCCDDTTYSGHTVFDPDKKNFITIGRNTPVVCGDCVGCGSYPMLIVMTTSEDPPEGPDNGVIVGPVYDIKGYKGDKLCSSVTLGKPVTLLLNYDPDELPGDTISVFIGYYNEETGLWEGLESTGTVAGPGVVTGIVHHMSTFAVIAETEEPAPPPQEQPQTPNPGAPVPEPEVTPPAHFVASDLEVTASNKVIGSPFAFLVERGQHVTISADIANDGGQGGEYSAALQINGETISTKGVTLNPGQEQEVTFSVALGGPGEYVVQIDDISGEFMAERWINVPLIVGLAIAFWLLVWGIWYLYRRRRRAI